MDTSLSEEIAEKSLSAKSTTETETGDQTEQDDPKPPLKPSIEPNGSNPRLRV
jgi:hypothetical protein